MRTAEHRIRPSSFHARLDALRAYLERSDVAAYAVTGLENTAYLTGWRPDVEAWERPVLTVVPRRAPPFMVLHELSTPAVRMAREAGRLVVDDVVHYVERPSTDPGTWTRARWGELVTARLAEVVPAGARVACDALTPALAEASVHGDGSFLPAPEVLTDARAVKDTEELDLMRAAAGLTDFAQDVFRELARPGALMAEVDAATTLRMRVEGAARFPASDLACRCSSLTGPASAAPHGTGAGSDDRIERGHGIVNIIVVTLAGYAVENERTLFVGPPDERQRRAYLCALEAQAAAVARCVPGAPLADVDRAALGVIERHGFLGQVLHRAGHGIGLRQHDVPEDMAFNERPLRAGEVYTIEPGIYLFGVGGFRIDDTVVVGEPPEALTATPRALDAVILPG